MSQQGEKPAAHEDDWWRKLYDDTAPDTGPSSAPDSLDDRFDSVSDTVSRAVGHQRETAGTADREAYAGPVPELRPERVPLPQAEEEPKQGPEAGSRPASRAEPEQGPRAGLRPDSQPDLRAEPGSDPQPELRSEPDPQPELSSGLKPDLRAEPGPESQPELSSELKPNPQPNPQPAPRPTPRPDPEPGPRPNAQPASTPERKPDPRTAWDPYQGRGSYEEQEKRPEAGVRPVAVPGPRNTVFPAPWEAPAAPPGPRTFAAPKPPEPEPPPAPPSAGPAGAPDPSALHELPPDWAASDAPADGGGARPLVDHLGDRPPTYDAEPAALPAATSENLDALVPDTVLDGARYGTYTLRAASVRGDSARFRGEPRRDALLTARFGAAESALVLVAVAGGVRAGEGAHLAAADACRWIGGAVARSHARLSEDIRAGRRADLKSGLHRLTDRTYGKLRARAAELGLEPGEYTASLRCLLLSADPDCCTRVFFGVGRGGLFRLRDGLWQDLEPVIPQASASSGDGVSEEGPDGDRLTMDLQITTPPSPYSDGPAPPPAELFRFRASVARPGDTLLLCSNGLAEPMRGEPELPDELAERWGPPGPPGLPAFLADTQLRIKGYADDRTCAAVWEA
ncbi:protein phosphatase 2C domain-containing protein [Streptomyces sp. NPDC056454]|uniref:protein phosphatase 2C domain-containing protein n=1 Tax=Streptomyces sp. NPDC056454 TaxID=3345823 RepID=UPI00368B7E7C